jgi:NhaP-type Na+/H+ and K+/H+ antiporter
VESLQISLKAFLPKQQLQSGNYFVAGAVSVVFDSVVVVVTEDIGACGTGVASVVVVVSVVVASSFFLQPAAKAKAIARHRANTISFFIGGFPLPFFDFVICVKRTVFY